MDQAAGGGPGDFRLGREIGRGGIGVVYEARQVSLGRRVAVKVLAPSSAAGGWQRRRFAIEGPGCRCAKSTPTIVSVIAYGDEEKCRIWRCADRGPEPGRGRPRPPASAPVRLRALAPAAQLAPTRPRLQVPNHHHDVLHRDLKPSNILLDAEEASHGSPDLRAGSAAGGSDLTATTATSPPLPHGGGPSKQGAFAGPSTPGATSTRWERRSTSCSPSGRSLGGRTAPELLIRILTEKPTPRAQHRPGDPARPANDRAQKRLAKDRSRSAMRRPANWRRTWHSPRPISRSTARPPAALVRVGAMGPSTVEGRRCCSGALGGRVLDGPGWREPLVERPAAVDQPAIGGGDRPGPDRLAREAGDQARLSQRHATGHALRLSARRRSRPVQAGQAREILRDIATRARRWSPAARSPGDTCGTGHAATSLMLAAPRPTLAR